MPRVACGYDKSSLTGHYAHRERGGQCWRVGGLTSAPGEHQGARERGLGLGLDAIGLAIAQTYVRRPGQPPMPSRAKGVGHAIAPTVQGRRPGPSRSLDPRGAGVGGLGLPGGRGRREHGKRAGE